MRNIVLIDGSPKVNEPSTSKYLVDAIGGQIHEAAAHKTFINVRQSIKKHKTPDDFAVIAQADAIIVVFPLYIFCMPGILTRYLEDYYKYYLEHQQTAKKPKVYAVVNCGFPEPGINLEAVRVIRSFSQHISGQFRCGVLIGGGAMLREAANAPFMKKTMKSLNDAFAVLIGDMASENLKDIDNINISMNFPRRLYMFMGDRGWKGLVRKNGLSKKDIYRRPYENK